MVAERQGQTAARNMLGRRGAAAVPFFWTEQYDVSLHVGLAERWIRRSSTGSSTPTRATVITYRRNGKTLASAFVQRDREGLRAEVELERISRGSVTSCATGAVVSPAPRATARRHGGAR